MSKDMDKVRWLLVGAGDIARKRVAPAMHDAKDAEIVGVCSRRHECVQALANEFDASESYTDFDEALEATQADAVYLATPVYYHVDHAIKTLQSGKHVLIEKPLGLNARECEPLLNAATQSGCKAACAYYRRFFPRFEMAKQMIEAGEFGRVVSVRMAYHAWFDPSPDDPKYWRVQKAKAGGGALYDMGSHMFDFLIALFGLPQCVYARCENLVHNWDVEDSASVVMILQNGAQVVFSCGWNSQTWRHEMEIIGTKARLTWSPFDSGAVLKTVGRETESLDLPNAQNVHGPLIEDFVQAVLTNRAPRVPLEAAAQTNLLLDAIYQSSNEKREISLPS